tara:strand:+ start:3143 stop:3586 length:444 start_codon:yes stop_codon:yes gene_type:complete
MKKNRYLLMLIGSSKGVEDDLDHIADSDDGVHFVDGSGIFMATFYSEYDTDEIYNLLSHRGAYLIFSIDDITKYGVNLPKKFYKGLFPEIEKIIPDINLEVPNLDGKEDIKKVNSLTNVNEILDKLENNNYDASCLTKKEQNILDSY